MPKHPPQFLNKQYGMLLAHEFSMVYSELSTTATGGVTKAQENSNISELFRVVCPPLPGAPPPFCLSVK